MIEVIQSVYIFILNMAYRVTGKIDKKVRNVIIWIVSFLLICLCIYNYTVWARESASTIRFERDVIGCVFLAVIAVFSIDGKLEKVKWNRLFVVIWYGLAGMMFLSGCIYSVGNSYWLGSFAMLFGFPGFYLIWQNRRDYQTLFNIISSAVLAVMLIYFALCLYMLDSDIVPLIGRYQFFTLNPNHVGNAMATGMVAALYLSLQTRNGWIYGAVCGICIKLATMSGSRTALVVIVTQLLVYLVFWIKTAIKDKMYSKILVRECMFLVLLCVSFWGYEKGVEYVQNIQKQESIAEQVREEQDLYASEEIVEQTTAISQLETVTIPLVMEETENLQESQGTGVSTGTSIPLKSVEVSKEDSNNTGLLKNRFSVEGKTLEQFSSGRITIWKDYLKEITLLGNDWERNKKGRPEYNYKWAHNDIVEIAYRSGAVAGIFEILFLVYLGIYILKRLCSKQKLQSFHCFAILSILTYGGYAMTEIISFPFSHQHTFLFFSALMPLFERESEWKYMK